MQVSPEPSADERRRRCCSATSRFRSITNEELLARSRRSICSGSLALSTGLPGLESLGGEASEAFGG